MGGLASKPKITFLSFLNFHFDIERRLWVILSVGWFSLHHLHQSGWRFLTLRQSFRFFPAQLFDYAGVFCWMVMFEMQQNIARSHRSVFSTQITPE